MAASGMAVMAFAGVRRKLVVLFAEHSSRAANTPASMSSPLLRKNAMMMQHMANIGIHALLLWVIFPLVLTKSKSKTVITTIAAENRGSFHNAMEYVAM